MSVFICSACGGFADSDDGCEDRSDRIPPYVQRLVCLDCADAPPEFDDEPINFYGDIDDQDRDHA